ncbi:MULTISPECIES: hypothetical protein [unclassified Cytobacillus]|uniref:hypothetical protein n=1 Tax=unclassified Cytobacillus TaxID=2675268 RepID=UPI002040D68B|nr:hypothetical protein [Cytobacillus sp. AMY 15.2]MCM3093043.1 hypothetical protein [Cytobacillus sp. AMY 15.2]
MARIIGDELFKINKSRNLIHQNVDCSFSTFFDNKGNKYFQLDTYGSNIREFKGKISQSLQLDKETAKILISILNEEFNINS